jgi:hypothetical protein
MCPFCLAAIAQIVAGAVSAGSLTALTVKLSRKKNNPGEIVSSNSIVRSNEDAQQNSR